MSEILNIAEKCKAEVEFGDDFGDNTCTFHCQLPLGHDGKHREVGNLENAFPYTLEWECTDEALEQASAKYKGGMMLIAKEGEKRIVKFYCPKCDTFRDIEMYVETGELHFTERNENGFCQNCKIEMEFVD